MQLKTAQGRIQKGSAYNEVHDGLEAPISSSDKPGILWKGGTQLLLSRMLLDAAAFHNQAFSREDVAWRDGDGKQEIR